MSLTVLEAQSHVEHALGGPLVGISNRRVLDDAGRFLLSLREWTFQKRPSTTLDFTASQSYITLPSDFGSIISIEFTQGLAQCVQQTTIGTIALYRSINAAIPGYVLYVAPVFEENSNAIPEPRLEIYPMPVSSTTAALTMFYRPRWVDIQPTDSTYISLPDWIEPLYIQLIRAFALGYQNDDMAERTATVLAGPIFQAALRTDMEMQTSYGPLAYGALDTANQSDPMWFLRNVVLPPAAV